MRLVKGLWVNCYNSYMYLKEAGSWAFSSTAQDAIIYLFDTDPSVAVIVHLFYWTQSRSGKIFKEFNKDDILWRKAS
jgi:hypothetical protein